MLTEKMTRKSKKNQKKFPSPLSNQKNLPIFAKNNKEIDEI
jgi:hypothetical protein